ncbi:ArsR family transcriptional regulator [Halomicrobium sp. IBSBa]|uniref:DUF7344 domain-containing protein n=1 Tax=Halomicrobium sp. IBSBa TaxID=2778916 RepID=UPI001ABEFECC|nr:hypothetical protein [Halomicrobium sp. IBSBa]MBO4247648.1 ArsR family transcriptional regulator [Halomicrobium sp. IBSBa]
MSTETVFEILSNRRRRYVLFYLYEIESTATVRDLSEQLAAWENGVDRSAVRPKERKRLYTALHQTHLPKMQQRGVVDRDRGTVAATDVLGNFDVYFRSRDRDRFPWQRWSLALSTLLLGVTSAAAAGLLSFLPLGGFDYALLGALTFSLVAVSHALGRWRLARRASVAPPELTMKKRPRSLATEADDG